MILALHFSPEDCAKTIGQEPPALPVLVTLNNQALEALIIRIDHIILLQDDWIYK